MTFNPSKSILPGVLILAVLGGCASNPAWKAPVIPPPAALFTVYSAPLTTNFRDVPARGKRGEASAFYFRDFIFTSFDFAFGNADIQSAAEQGGLSKIYYADYSVVNVLWMFCWFNTTAYGE